MKHTKQTGRSAVRWAAHGNCNTFIFFLIMTWQMAQKFDAAAAVRDSRPAWAHDGV